MIWPKRPDPACWLVASLLIAFSRWGETPSLCPKPSRSNSRERSDCQPASGRLSNSIIEIVIVVGKEATLVLNTGDFLVHVSVYNDGTTENHCSLGVQPGDILSTK
jgi:hypothetical protein